MGDCRIGGKLLNSLLRMDSTICGHIDCKNCLYRAHFLNLSLKTRVCKFKAAFKSAPATAILVLSRVGGWCGRVEFTWRVLCQFSALGAGAWGPVLKTICQNHWA